MKIKTTARKLPKRSIFFTVLLNFFFFFVLSAKEQIASVEPVAAAVGSSRLHNDVIRRSSTAPQTERTGAGIP